MISIIVAVYNTEKYIRECLDSIINQSYSNWEAIIIDDGSTDLSGEICDEYVKLDSRISVIHQENGGLSHARNVGLNASHGNYIMFVDSDDMLPDDSLIILRNMLVNSESDIACGEFISFKSVVDRRHKYLESNDICKKYNSKEAIRMALYQNGINNSAWGKLYKKKIWADLRFRPGIGYEDLDIFYKTFLRANSILYTKNIVYLYRRNMQSILNTFSNLRLDVLNITREIVDFMDANIPELLPAAKSRRISANFNIIGILPRQKYSDIETGCWNVIKKLRKDVLFDWSSPKKNKLFIVLSFLFPRKLLIEILRIYYCSKIYIFNHCHN